LRGWTFNSKQTLQLRGEWAFYPSELATSGKALTGKRETFLHIPGNWKTVFPNDGRTFHYGTYRLRILLDDVSKQLYGLRIIDLPNASAVYVNGEKIGGKGTPARNEKEHKGDNLSYEAVFHADGQEVELVVPVSSNVNKGGMIKPIRFGSAEAIKNRSLLSQGLQMLLLLMFLLHSLYAAMMYFIRMRPYKGLFYFSLLLICAMVSVLGSDDKLLFRWFDVIYAWRVKVTYLSYIGVGAFMLLVVHQLFPVDGKLRTLRYYIAYAGFYALFVLVSPVRYILETSRVLLLAALVLSFVLATDRIRRARARREENMYLLLGCISVGVNIAWSTYKSNQPALEMMHYPFDLIVALLCFAAFWFKRFSRVAGDAERFAHKLQMENQRKDVFLVNTSHELRNPLHGIHTIIQTLLDDRQRPLHPEHRERLSILIQVSRRMSLMLNDLVDMTRLKEKTIQLNLQSIRAEPVVTGVLDMMKLLVEGKPVQLQADIPAGFPLIKADETRVVQILFNLLHNAVKYTDTGQIVVRASAGKTWARLSVEDTGIGMTHEELDTVFEPYEQAAANKERGNGGFGLGLAISRQLAELQGGTLSAKSEPGKGSVFTLSLPLADKAVQPALPVFNTWKEPTEASWVMADEPGEDAYGKKRILAVDDDPVNIRVLLAVLEGENYLVTAVTDPREALKKLETSAYDLVIADVMMPHMSGYELTRIIRDRFAISDLPVLLLTARAHQDDIITGFQSGANDYVTKPVDSDELKARVYALTTLKTSIEERIRMEGAWMQSQIQPHFIFNTLNAIAALGMLDTNKMHALLEEFSNYLRLSFDFHNAEPVVALEQELSLVRSYLYIEQTRFAGRLNIEWDLDAEDSVMIPPLSIQPLVENAVVHGVLKRKEGGTIAIRIKERGEYTEVAIIDNGAGMKADQVHQLLSKRKPQERTSVGLRNVNTRLKQLYGEGLHIRTTPGQGTAVSFHLPKKSL